MESQQKKEPGCPGVFTDKELLVDDLCEPVLLVLISDLQLLRRSAPAAVQEKIHVAILRAGCNIRRVPAVLLAVRAGQLCVGYGRFVMDAGAASTEYQLLAVGDLELWQIHDVLVDLERQGWQLDTTYDAEHPVGGAGAALDLRLKRRH